VFKIIYLPGYKESFLQYSLCTTRYASRWKITCKWNENESILWWSFISCDMFGWKTMHCLSDKKAFVTPLIHYKWPYKPIQFWCHSNIDTVRQNYFEEKKYGIDIVSQVSYIRILHFLVTNLSVLRLCKYYRLPSWHDLITV